MGQVAFDTQEFVEILENAGIAKEHARAISLAVRKSHEVADVATKADVVELKHEITELNRNIADVRKDLSVEIADVRKDLSVEIADVRKDLSVEIADVCKDLSVEIAGIRKDLSAEIVGVRKDLSAEIAGVHKDMEHRFDKNEAHMEALTNKLLIKVTKVIIGCVGLASTVVTLIIQFL